MRSSLLPTASARAVLFSSALPREMLRLLASSSAGVGSFSFDGSCVRTQDTAAEATVIRGCTNIRVQPQS